MQEVKAFLEHNAHEYEDFGAYSEERCDYPTFAINAAGAIAAGRCDMGIFICGTGIGMSIAANKIPKIRAAVCNDCYSAEMARAHNNANVLALGSRVVGQGLALKIVSEFLSRGFDGGRHEHRVDMINNLDAEGIS